MKNKLKNIQNKLMSRQGMTLVEVLVAMTIVVLIIITFTPLFMQNLRNIRTAGEISQSTYEKASLLERLIANKGENAAGYETSVGNVPIILNCSGATSVDFSTSDTIGKVNGTIITNNTGNSNSYTTFYTEDTSTRMVCFPSNLTDDFLTTDIVVVPKGFKFNSIAENKNASTTSWHFEVYYTDASGNEQVVGKQYYDIVYKADGESNVAVFTFKGANDVICFENSPIIIKYGSGAVMGYSVEVEIGAPEMIMVGEKASNGKYYYYATSGVDPVTGHMDLIAKEMTGDNQLTSAMNDVEWVEKGRGDDGNGGVNQYGYYVMGGDAGQVRRFWRNETTGNYYWGGDLLTNYDRYAYLNGNGTTSTGGYETLTPTVTTQASFKSIFRSNQEKVTVNGIIVNLLCLSEKWGPAYNAITTNYFTANITMDDAGKYFATMGGVAKIRSGKTLYQYYGDNGHASWDEIHAMVNWLTGSSLSTSRSTKLDVNGYKEATNYEYNGENGSMNDNSLITITSVGAIQLNTVGNKDNYVTSQASTTYNSNVYPTSSYTLYCGYIPSVNDAFGCYYSNGSKYMHVGTYGLAYSSQTGSWYPTGKFGDIYTNSTTLSSSIFPDLSYRKLLNYYDEKSEDRDTVYPYPTYTEPSWSNWAPNNNKWLYYKAGELTGGVYGIGQALPAEGNDYYMTSGNEVDITMGYLSQPFAIGLQNPATAVISGLTGSDYYFNNAASGKYDHSFFSAGLRDNVTLLDVKSYHDDITGNNVSLAAGYTVGYICDDYSTFTRVHYIYNTGVVYIRATGDGSNSDDTGSMESGKGWSLAKETNVFHKFYGIDQYQDGSGIRTVKDDASSDSAEGSGGWRTYWHRAYFNISSSDSKAPQAGYSPSLTEGNNSYGTNCHPMAQTECNCVNWGTTWDYKPQAMWGTDNGTLLSWYYNYENKTASKITSVTKEFESYLWADRYGAVTTSSPLKNSSDKKQFYDYNSVHNGDSDTYGFVSVLSSVNDVCCGDGTWVAAGDQSGKAPSVYCASSAGYTGNGSAASYINVKYCYDTTNNKYAWKAVKIDDRLNVNIVSVTYCQGIWYAMGYVDADGDGINDTGEESVIYYSINPETEWKLCETRKADGKYRADTTTALYYDVGGNCQEIKLEGINSMASQG